MKQEYMDFIRATSLKVSIDGDLFCAIVNAESAWDPNAVRYEKGYPYLYNPSRYASIENITIATETVLQQMSFGLCQLMGANARAAGYAKPLMTLFDPFNNITAGVDFFKKRCNVHQDIKDKISSYNAGSPIKKGDTYINQGYVDKVYTYYLELKKQDK